MSDDIIWNVSALKTVLALSSKNPNMKLRQALLTLLLQVFEMFE